MYLYTEHIDTFTCSGLREYHRLIHILHTATKYIFWTGLVHKSEIYKIKKQAKHLKSIKVTIHDNLHLKQVAFILLDAI